MAFLPLVLIICVLTNQHDKKPIVVQGPGVVACDDNTGTCGPAADAVADTKQH